MLEFDVLIIGGGHAGLEAACLATQFLNIQVAILTMPGVPIASAPCNPAIGGVGKGQVVREIDALGGVMGMLADKAGIQYRTLNSSKGYAVQSTRVQIDKELYSIYAEELVRKISNLTVIRERVDSIKLSETGLFKVKTAMGSEIKAKKVIMTTGTFLDGKLHSGKDQTLGGRRGFSASLGMKSIFLEVKTLPVRFKTGTPPRLKVGSVNYSVMEKQPSDPLTLNFHCLNQPFQRQSQQVCCYLTKTNEKTLQIIRDNKAESPIFNGQIKGVGPRYCPSIEDKAFRYPDRNSHHIFIEPEGLNLDTLYPNGISTSLPESVQKEFLQTISGLEEAEMAIPGYAVEYDVVDTTKLNSCLEYQDIPGLYFAGQVNGTSGYEEAAGQGLIAGINAALSVLNCLPLILSRNDSYIGVMIEDLITNQRDEPYRLFTARSENRLQIREDNALNRMFQYRKILGLKTELDHFHDNYQQEYAILWELTGKSYENQEMGEGKFILEDLLRQANFDPVKVMEKFCQASGVDFLTSVINAVAISKKYEGYIVRANIQNKKIEKFDGLRLNWQEIIVSPNISYECRQRIEKIRPETFGQLRLIEGIRPATLAIVASKVY